MDCPFHVALFFVAEPYESKHKGSMPRRGTSVDSCCAKLDVADGRPTMGVPLEFLR